MTFFGSVILFLVLQFASGCIALAAPEDAPPVLTVCEALKDPPRYDGRTVIVVGRFSFTDEGSWLDEECGFKVVSHGREFPAAISTAYVVTQFAAPPKEPRGFQWDKRLLEEKLEQVMQTTHLRVYKDVRDNDQWLAVFGRLETRLPRRVKMRDGPDEVTFGFGHLSAAPAQLIAPRNGSLRLQDK